MMTPHCATDEQSSCTHLGTSKLNFEDKKLRVVKFSCVRWRDLEKTIQSCMPMIAAITVAMDGPTTLIVSCISSSESYIVWGQPSNGLFLEQFWRYIGIHYDYVEHNRTRHTRACNLSSRIQWSASCLSDICLCEQFSYGLSINAIFPSNWSESTQLA